MKIDITTKILLGLVAAGLFATAFRQPIPAAQAKSYTDTGYAMTAVTDGASHYVYVAHSGKLTSYIQTGSALTKAFTQELP